MITTLTQQPNALRIAEQLRDISSRFKTPSYERGVCNAAIEELQELAAKSGLAHRITIQQHIQTTVAEAVTAEREACAELMEQQHTWITNVAASALIRARGTPCS